MRLHITGAAGSGTTSLGKALAEEFVIAHLDTDDFFWLPTDPPFSEVRPKEERLRLLSEAFAETDSWVLSGFLGPWSVPLHRHFDLVVFLLVPTEVRLDRLRRRESHGPHAKRYAPGGDRHVAFERFLAWAAEYDSGGQDMRSRAHHEIFLKSLRCPVLRLEGEIPLQQQVAACRAAVHQHRLADETSGNI
jgi:adenylate kinase family enzyme